MDFFKFGQKNRFFSRRALWPHTETTLAIALLLCLSLIAFSANGHNQADSTVGPVLVLQKGNTLVDAVAFSPNDQFVATGGSDSVVKLWDVSSEKLLRNLQGSSTFITALAFSNREGGRAGDDDGKWLAAGNAGGQVIVWNMLNGQVLCNREKVVISIKAIAFSPNNRWLAVGATTGEVKVFNTQTWEPLPTLEVETYPLFALAFSGDNSQLAAITGDEESALQKEVEVTGEEEGEEKEEGDAPQKTIIRVWETATWQPRPPLNGPADASKLTFTPDNRLIVAAVKSYEEDGKGNEIRFAVWDSKDWTELASPSLKVGKYADLVFSKDGRRMVALSQDPNGFSMPSLKTWETADLKQPPSLFRLTSFAPIYWRMDLDGDAKQVAVATLGDIEIINLSQPEKRKKLSSAIQGVQEVAFSRDGRLLASAYADGWVRVWDLAAGRPFRAFPVKDKMGLPISNSSYSLTFSPDHKLLLVGAGGGFNETLRVYDALAGSESPLSKKLARSNQAAFSPDGKWLLTAGSALQLWEWSGDGPKEIEGWDPPSLGFGARSIAFSPDGRWLAVADSDNEVHIWEMTDEKWVGVETPLTGPKSSSDITNLVFSSDSRLLLAGAKLTPLKVWEVAPGRDQWKEVSPFSANSFESVAAGPEGLMATAGTLENRLKLWDLKTGREVTQPFEGHVSTVTSVVFDPRNRWLASSSSDGTVRLWNPRTGKLIASLVSFGQDKYWGTNTLVVSADGLFDGTADSMRQADWRYAGDENILNVFSMNLFFDHFYYPGLLAEIFAGDVPRPQQDLAQRLRLPGLRLMMRQNLVRVQERAGRPVVCFVDPPSVRDLGIFIDGTQLTFNPATLKSAQEDKDCPYFAELPAGDKQIELVSLLKEEQAQVKPWVGPKSEVADSTLHVLTVGITKYPKSSIYGRLPYAVSDAKEIETFFAEQQANPRTPFKNVRIHQPLYDEDATLDFIRRKFADMSREMKEKDVAFIYFSGHGAVPPGEAMFYFAPVDAHSLRLGTTGFNSAMFAEALRNMPARRIVLIVDACQSGGVVESLGRIGDMKNSFEQRLSQRTGANPASIDNPIAGVHIIASATPLQEALQPAQLRKGVMAKVLLEALRAQRATADGRVWMKDVIDYINQHLTQTSQEASPEQRQRALIQSVGLDFPIAASPSSAARANEPARRYARSGSGW